MKIKFLIRRFFFKLYFVSNAFYDKIFGEIEKKVKGVDFLINITPNEINEEGYNYDKYVHYVPSKGWQIKKVIKALNIHSEDAILDYGCGKGKALFEFSKYPFKKIGGVELSTDLATIAQNNMKKLNLSDIEIYNDNALDFKAIDDYNHFFFFDPFNKDVFKGVVDNIIESCDKNPREISITYTNPRGHDKLLDTTDGFTHFKTLQIPMKAVIYRYSVN